MTLLHQAMIDQCRLRGLSARTEEIYLYAVEQISRGKREGDILSEALNTEKYSLDETGDEIRNNSSTAKNGFRLSKINS